MKTALVTGAAGNMGRAVVEKFISGGYFVAGTVIPQDHSVLDFPREKFKKVSLDILDAAAAEKLVEDLANEKGSIDAAILTVGGFAMGSIQDTSSGDILEQYQLNFETTYNVARPVFNQMMKQGKGRIFIIGSKGGLAAIYGKGMVAYSLAKSLIFRLAELMNEESKGKDVVTSVVVPSTIDTPQNRHAMPDANFENWVPPGSIADVIYWHCSGEAAALREPVLKVYNKA